MASKGLCSHLYAFDVMLADSPSVSERSVEAMVGGQAVMRALRRDPRHCVEGRRVGPQTVKSTRISHCNDLQILNTSDLLTFLISLFSPFSYPFILPPHEEST